MRLVVLALALVALFGCKRGSSEGANGSKRVRVQLNWVPEPEFGGIYAARESGAYARAGVEVEIASGAAGTPVLQIVGSGQADFGVVRRWIWHRRQFHQLRQGAFDRRRDRDE